MTEQIKWWVTIEYAFRLGSRPNMRGSWQVQAWRTKSERRALRLAWMGRGSPRLPLVRTSPVEITFTRRAPRELDRDNLIASFKGKQDEMTRLLGFSSDRDPELVIDWRQERSRDYAVRVDVVTSYTRRAA